MDYLCLRIWKVSITKPISRAGTSTSLPVPLLSFSSPFFSSTGTLPFQRFVYNHDDNYIVLITLIILMLISEMVHFKRSNQKVARIAVSGLPKYSSIFHFPPVKGVTSQLFLIIWWLRQYIFWMNIFKGSSSWSHWPPGPHGSPGPTWTTWTTWTTLTTQLF